MDYETQSLISELRERVDTLEQFAAFIADQLEPEDDDVENVLESFHQRFASRAKGKRG